MATNEDDPEQLPWHPRHCPAGIADAAAWARSCRDYCRRIRKGAGNLRRDLSCRTCGFAFVYHTSRPTPRPGSEASERYDEIRCCNPECRASRRVYNLDDDDSTTTPWHPGNCPWDVEDPEEWSARCRAWCEQLIEARPGQILTAHPVQCRHCGFYFCVRTQDYSLDPRADVVNHATCCNPECRAEVTDYD